MAKAKNPTFKKSQLTKGQLRKLNALRKSLEDPEIADEAFAKWYAKFAGGAEGDKTAALISKTLEPLRAKGKLRIPRGGYLVKSGRGRVVVERADR